MNEQAIEEIKNAVRELVKLLAARGKPLSEELKLHLAQVIEYAGERIQELRNAPIEPIAPEVDPAPYESSNINGFKYDDKTGELVVKFQDKYPGQNGPVYSYSGVPKFIFDVFSRGAVAPKTSGQNDWHAWKKGVTPSLGAAMWALIRNGGFKYQKLT